MKSQETEYFDGKNLGTCVGRSKEFDRCCMDVRVGW